MKSGTKGDSGATAENCFPARNRIVHAKLMKMDAESEGYIARGFISQVRYLFIIENW